MGSLLDVRVLLVFVWTCLSLIWGNLSSSLFKFSFKICFFYFMFMSVLPASLCVHVCTRCPQKSAEGIKFLGTDVLDGWKSPCGYWELDLLREQQVLLITGLSPQTVFYDFVKGLFYADNLGFFSFIYVYSLKVWSFQGVPQLLQVPFLCFIFSMFFARMFQFLPSVLKYWLSTDIWLILCGRISLEFSNWIIELFNSVIVSTWVLFGISLFTEFSFQILNCHHYFIQSYICVFFFIAWAFIVILS